MLKFLVSNSNTEMVPGIGWSNWEALFNSKMFRIARRL